ncbi:hypothetical protein GCM10017608_31310 [Agromyces luteolus]|uniref:Uncharacterized protein n=1 Tax=Agromyces luteolus TaxID=88373 RepID=A0A7C9HLY4_9MICO|nr:hypothetical protein [Agromyces luteolus]MUN07844.1 hypothetical protein [Agromyces luteolus]GLK29195.1 hypothetical protein GCM10017608_31310 [Agromyces luteolus]
MGENTLHAVARPHLSDTVQNSGWAIAVTAGGGRVLDVEVVHPRDIGEDGDEAAIRDKLAKRYDVSGLEFERGFEETDDGLREPVIRITGLREAS